MPAEQNSNADNLERTLIDIAVESWRFSKLFARVVDRLDAGEAKEFGLVDKVFEARPDSDAVGVQSGTGGAPE